MKYIKLFENLYYKEVTDPGKIHDVPDLDMDPSNVEKIEKFLLSIGINSINHKEMNNNSYYRVKNDYGDYNIEDFKPSEIKQVPYQIEIFVKSHPYLAMFQISQRNDEWFKVRVQSNKMSSGRNAKYYLCDQLEGLFKFLEKNVINPVKENISNRNEYYEKITEDEYMGRFEYPVGYKLSKDNVNKLKFVKDIETNYFDYYDLSSTPNGYIAVDYEKPGRTLSIIIKELDDEFFLAKVSYSIDRKEYYKCDQFDSVLRLMIDVGIIPKNMKSWKENKINENVTNYYEEIDKDDYLIENKIKLNKKDFNIIAKEPHLQLMEFDGIIFITGEDEIRGYVGVTTHITIECDNDEWYYVVMQKMVDPKLRVFNIKYYKCDQLEGIIKLLQDKDIISKKLNENVEEKFHKEINYDKFKETPSIKIEKRSVEEIIKIFKNNHNLRHRYEDINIEKSTNNGLQLVCSTAIDDIKYEDRSYLINILQLEDEWFKVCIEYYIDERSGRSYHLCDQIYGIEQLLRDYKIIGVWRGSVNFVI